MSNDLGLGPDSTQNRPMDGPLISLSAIRPIDELSEKIRINLALVWRAVAVLVGALLMSWPALYNRYPLLYPDSMAYLSDGRPVARALFLHSFSEYYGLRSLIYSLGILPLHWNVNPWPIVAVHALLTAYVLWLVVRSILPRKTVTCYLILIASLSLLTGMGWFVSLIMPDIFGPVLYLSIYLLVFAGETLSRAERLSIFVIAWFAVASHATHLVLAIGLCLVVASLLVFRRQSRYQHLKAIGGVITIIVVAAASQIALHKYLYGEASLNGERPPFLMARIIADGTGRLYLQRHCGEIKLTICEHVRELQSVTDTDAFLWSEDGVWQSVSRAEGKQLRKEELPLVLATLRKYPREQLSVSAGNFWQQLTLIAMWGYEPSPWILEVFEDSLPGSKQNYLRSRQAQDAMPEDFSTTAQKWTVIASLLLVCGLALSVWRRRPPKIIGFAVVIVFVLISNAFVSGVLSNPEDRYESRVIWLLPLLAGVLVLELLEHRSAMKRYTTSQSPIRDLTCV